MGTKGIIKQGIQKLEQIYNGKDFEFPKRAETLVYENSVQQFLCEGGRGGIETANKVLKNAQEMCLQKLKISCQVRDIPTKIPKGTLKAERSMTDQEIDYSFLQQYSVEVSRSWCVQAFG